MYFFDPGLTANGSNFFQIPARPFVFDVLASSSPLLFTFEHKGRPDVPWRGYEDVEVSNKSAKDLVK